MTNPSPLMDVRLPGRNRMVLGVSDLLSHVMPPNGARSTPPCSISGAASVMAPNAEYGVAGVSPAARRSVRTASGLYLAISPCGPRTMYSPMAMMPPDRVTG
ncbi:hypothetical protein G6F32_017086 [Rhizopus arrhizus]|nr:hypothetical protein G6F32_017086 [Rhizopus arrhizus]